MGSRSQTIGRSACAVVLSFTLALGPTLDGAAAWADDPSSAETSGGGASQLDSAAEGGAGEPEGSQHVETVELPEASGQASAEAPLSQDPKPVAGEVRSEGLVYSVNADGVSVALVGWCGDAPSGDVVVPAAVSSGADSYAVVSLGNPLGDGLFAGASVEHLSIPASVASIADGALSGCPTLSALFVNSKNETFASFDGMLFSKDLSSLLLVPAGKEGAALIPDPATSVPAGAFSRAPGLCEAVVGEGSASFSSWNGLLYSKDMKTLVACPPGAGDAVVVPASVEAIADGAFAGCAVASVTVLGDVREIAAGAFDEAARAEAVVALPGGEDYEARRAVWEAAGFARFAEPARPGDVSAPEAPGGEGGSGGEGGAEESGLAYEVLDDYTLAASWAGPEGPSGELAIPAAAEVGGVSYRVSAVADAGFAGCSGLTAVELPAGLTAVGERAFEACGLADVWLPASVASVGPRAFAACPSLGRVVALGAADAAPDALAEDAGVSVYCPSGSEASWNMGLPAAGNHLMPYGIALAEDPLQLEAGQSASLLDGGSLLAPEPVEASYSYAAKPLSVDADGVVAGKAEGSSEVSVALTLDAVELARATRAVEVAAEPAPSVTPENDEANQQGFVARAVRLLDTVFPEGLRSGADAAANGEAFTSADGELTFAVLPDETGAHAVSVKLSPGYAPAYVDIPGIVEHEGIAYAVTEVAEAGFADATSIEVVTLPETLTVIRPNAFIRCSSLHSVAIPASVETIYNGVFNSNASLTEVRFAEDSQLKTIGMSAFSGTALTSVSFPASLEELGSHAFRIATLAEVSFAEDSRLRRISAQCFQDCAKLSSISIPASVQEILNAAFANTGLNEVRFSEPSSLEVIQAGAFQGCPLVSVDIPSSVRDIASKVFMSCTSLERVAFGAGSRLAGIGAQCFQGCTALESIDIPQAVIKLGDSSFASCSRLARVEFEEPSALETIVNFAFGNCTSLRAIELPDSVNSIAKSAFQGCSSLKTVDVGAGISSIPALAFSGCSSLQSILASDSVSNVDLLAFDDVAKSSAYVVLPIENETAFDAVKQIWVQAGFDEHRIVAAEGALPTQGGTQNGSWKLDPDGTLHIRSEQAGAVIQDLGWTESSHSSGGWAPVRGFVERIELDASIDAVNMNWWFSDMPRLVEAPFFDIPASVKGAIGLYYGCTSLVSLPEGFMLPDSLGEIRNMFMGCTSLKTLPDGFAIPRGSEESPLQPGVLFMDCVSLERLPESFVFREGSTATVVNGMFMNCSSLEELPSGFCFPDSVEKADGTFGGCSSLGALPNGFRVPGKLEVSQKMFEGCSSLASLPGGFSLPESLLNAHLMFSGCSSLVSLPEGFTIPVNRDINVERLFENCSSLVSLPAAFRIPARTGGSIKLNNLFDGCVSLVSLPDGLTVPSDLDPNGMKGLFRNCVSLTSLPDGFAFPVDGAKAATDAGESPFWCDVEPGGPRVATYYAGSDAAVLAYDWEGDNRTLVTEPDDMGGWGMRRVTFKVQGATPDEDGAFPWETRSTAWTSKQGVLADPGAPQLEGYTFSGWCTDEDCLEPFDFSKPLETDRELYGTWIVHGGRTTALGEGQLPVESGTGEAWWQITSDGTLMILGDGTVPDFGWRWDISVSDAVIKEHWGPYRNSVKRIVMGDELGAVNMASWFQTMRSLTDIDGLRIPDGVTSIHCLFKDCSSLSVVPDDFHLRIPKSATNIRSLFNGCSSLAELPEGFAIPSSVRDMGTMFSNTKLRTVPQSFSVPEGVVVADELFCGCRELVSLPVGFTIPDSVTCADQFFYMCVNLKSLPEGFSVSKRLGKRYDMDNMFYGCASLTHLPASFDFPLEIAEGAVTPFWCEKQTTTYFAGDADSASSVLSYSKWSEQNREIVTSVPSGQWTVAFDLPDVATGEQKPWTKQLAADGSLIPELVAPTRVGSEFAGWYSDVDCTVQFDFSKPIAGNTTLYGKYQERSGELPTTDGGFNASWSISADGVLSIACDPGATIVDLGWFGGLNDFGYPVMAADASSEHWGPLRDLVKRIEMSSEVRVEGGVDFWFADMKNLVDASGAFLPDGIASARGAFQGDERLQLLSDGFVVPESVTDASVMLVGCAELEKLPRSFTLPSALENAAGLFDGCASLRSLPSSLELPESLRVARGMVAHCAALEYLPAGFVPHEGLEDMNCMFLESTSLGCLPEGFTIPNSANDVVSLFYHCSSLETLPMSFRIPDDVATTNFESMFNGCESLRALPEGFAVPAKAENAHCMFKQCESLTRLPASLDLSAWADTAKVRSTQSFLLPGEPFSSTPLITYYPGDASNVLGANWWKQWNRTLVDGSSGIPSGSFEVTFKIRAPGETTTQPWMVELTAADAEGLQRVPDPGAPERFGYVFSGWKDEATGRPFDFSQPVAASAVLVGSYVAIVEFEVPLSAKVTVDAQGTVSSAPMRFVSHAPVELLIKSVEANAAPGASRLFASSQDLAKTRIDVGFGNKSVSLALGERETYLGSIAPASAVRPGMLDGSIGLNLNGAQIDYQPGDDITSFAKLTWTVEVLP